MNTIRISKRVIGSKKQRGQGMTEYIIIVALVAIAAIAVFSAFGGTVKAEVAQITNGLTGNQAGITAAKTRSTAAATKANTTANKTLGMDSYTEDAAAKQ